VETEKPVIVSEQKGQSPNGSRGRRKDNRLLSPQTSKALWAFLAICVLFTQAFSADSAAGQEDSAGEYELKAAILISLIRFVEWPPPTYSDSHAPTELCILGWDPFGASLTSLVSKKLVDGRPVQIRHLNDNDGARACQVLYISSSERKRIVQVLSNLKGSSVLTVGDMGQFAARGGMVQFALVDKRVVLEINLDAANRAGVKISSRLLAISRIVKDQGNGSSRKGSSTDSQRFATTGPGHGVRLWKFARAIGNAAPQADSHKCDDSPRFGSHSSLESC
jgi:hypothetical protein